MTDWKAVSDRSEARLLATPYEQLGPAGRILVDAIVSDGQSPEPVPADECLQRQLREAESQQAERRAQRPVLRAELVTIDEQIKKLQTRRQFVAHELREIDRAEDRYREQVDEIELAGRALIANGRLPDLIEPPASLKA